MPHLKSDKILNGFINLWIGNWLNGDRFFNVWQEFKQKSQYLPHAHLTSRSEIVTQATTAPGPRSKGRKKNGIEGTFNTTWRLCIVPLPRLLKHCPRQIKTATQWPQRWTGRLQAGAWEHTCPPHCVVYIYYCFLATETYLPRVLSFSKWPANCPCPH